VKKAKALIKAGTAETAAPAAAKTADDRAYDNRLGKAVEAHTELTGTVPTGLRLASIVKRIKMQMKEEADLLKAKAQAGSDV